MFFYIYTQLIPYKGNMQSTVKYCINYQIYNKAIMFFLNKLNFEVVFTVKRSFHSSFLPCCSVFCQFYILIISLCCQLSGVKHDVIWDLRSTEIIVIFKCRYGADEPAAMSSFQLYHREIFTQGFPPIICLYCEVNRNVKIKPRLNTLNLNFIQLHTKQ